MPKKIRKISKNLISLRWDKYFPRLYISEKYENKIKWILRAISIVGIIISFLILPFYIAGIVSIFLLLIEQFFERTVYRYTTLYVQPFPDFEYDSSKWEAMLFHGSMDPKIKIESQVGFVFNDLHYASKFFELLYLWNYNNYEDKENNIQITFLIDEDKYYVYLYPSLNRKTITDFRKTSTEEFQLEKYGKEHFQIILSTIICKSFSTMAGYSLGKFLKHHKKDESFLLTAYLKSDENIPTLINEIHSIRKWHFKSKNRLQLDEKDFELFHFNKVINK